MISVHFWSFTFYTYIFYSLIIIIINNETNQIGMKESKSKSVYLYHLRCLFRRFFHFLHERLLLSTWPVNRPKFHPNWLYLPWSFYVLKKGKIGLTAKRIRKLYWKYADKTVSWDSTATITENNKGLNRKENIKYKMLVVCCVCDKD